MAGPEDVKSETTAKPETTPGFVASLTGQGYKYHRRQKIQSHLDGGTMNFGRRGNISSPIVLGHNTSQIWHFVGSIFSGGSFITSQIYVILMLRLDRSICYGKSA